MDFDQGVIDTSKHERLLSLVFAEQDCGETLSCLFGEKEDRPRAVSLVHSASLVSQVVVLDPMRTDSAS